MFVFVSKPGSFLRSFIGSRLPRRCGPHPLPAKRETRPLPSDNDPERERARRGRRRSSAPVRPRQTPSHRTPDRARALSAREPASAASAGRLPPRDPHQPCLLLTEMRPADGRPNPAAGSPPHPAATPHPSDRRSRASRRQRLRQPGERVPSCPPRRPGAHLRRAREAAPAPARGSSAPPCRPRAADRRGASPAGSDRRGGRRPAPAARSPAAGWWALEPRGGELGLCSRPRAPQGFDGRAGVPMGGRAASGAGSSGRGWMDGRGLRAFLDSPARAAESRSVLRWDVGSYCWDADPRLRNYPSSATWRDPLSPWSFISEAH